MSADAVARLPKPQMRGLFRSYLKKHLAIATVLSVAGSIAWKVFVSDPRKQRYADFYKTYDVEKEYARMEAAGVVPPFPEID